MINEAEKKGNAFPLKCFSLLQLFLRKSKSVQTLWNAINHSASVKSSLLNESFEWDSISYFCRFKERVGIVDNNL